MKFFLLHSGFSRLMLLSVLLLGLALSFTSCRKGDLEQDKLPNTKISLDSIDLRGENRLNSVVNLSWFGTDGDGYIIGYEVSLDGQNWNFTEQSDSTFTFSIPKGQDTADISLFVRAIDNDQNKDQTPAQLRVPLRNSTPQASFENDKGPSDTALVAVTFSWQATDLDGDQTISQVEMKFNNGDWFPVATDENLVSFLIDPNSTNTAQLYYGNDQNPESTTVNGILPDALNKVYIRATDIAGAQSEVDTAQKFYFKTKNPNARTLWVSGHTPPVTDFYRKVLNTLSITYDFLNYGTDLNGDNLPNYWEPTFRLIASQYDVLFLNSGGNTFTNEVSGRRATILNFAAPVVQNFTGNGGKYFITTRFSKGDDLTNITGPYPVSGLVTTQGNSQARMYPDSTLYPVNLTNQFPVITPGSSTVVRDVVPIEKPGDARDFYRAQLTKFNGWTGDNLIAASRSSNGRLSQVFFAQELHNYNGDRAQLIKLFEEILINEF